MLSPAILNSVNRLITLALFARSNACSGAFADDLHINARAEENIFVLRNIGCRVLC